MTKIAHIADIHLRQRQYGSYERGEDFLKGLISALSAAKDNNIYEVIAAGDLLDSNNPGSPVCITQLDKVQEYLVENKMRMYTISGNHDKTSPSWCSRFGDGEFGIIPIDNKTVTVQDVISIVGVPYMTGPEMREALKNGKIPKGDILVWHGDVAEMCGFPPEGSITINDLTADKLWKVVALGHIHKHQKVEENGVVVTYSGSTERCEKSDTDPKRMFVYEFDNGELSNIQSLPFEIRHTQHFQVHTSEELKKAISEFEDNSVIFIDYSKSIDNAMIMIEASVHEGNFLRATPIPNKTKQACDVAKRESIVDPVAFLKLNIGTMVEDKDRADRILPLGIAILSPESDYFSAIETYCNDKLESINI